MKFYGIRTLTVILVLFSLLVAAGCGDSDEAKKFSQKLGETYDAAVDAFKAEKERLMDKVDDQMEKTKAYLDALNAAAKEEGGKAVVELREQLDALQEEMKKAKEAGQETWDKTKDDLAEAVAQLQERLEEVKQKLKEE